MQRRLEKIDGKISPVAAYEYLMKLEKFDEEILSHYELETGPKLVVEYAWECKDLLRNDPRIVGKYEELKRKAKLNDFSEMSDYGCRRIMDHVVGMAVGLDGELMDKFMEIFDEEYKKLQESKAIVYGSINDGRHKIRESVGLVDADLLESYAE